MNKLFENIYKNSLRESIDYCCFCGEELDPFNCYEDDEGNVACPDCAEFENE